MSRIPYKWRVLFLRCLFLVVGIAFFAGQFSYKFYMYASMAVHQLAQKSHTSVVAKSAVIGMAASRPGSACLTLDKRYDLSAPFGPIPPVFQLILAGKWIRLMESRVTQETLTHPHFLFLLRGPPTLFPLI